ncbi:hypothetical protein [Actinomadura sp. WMMA1423]|uniref:hypothetical protein n=1 Tax=Actinomadura sp. WMMA1423 TaxID=2591108 RepID=UPI00114692D1|nr:hypothetical protein [Actinomadura sp. WMMA1423]
MAVLLYVGTRVEECARLELEDIPITGRTVPLAAFARVHLTAWLDERGRAPARYGLANVAASGISEVVLAVGEDGRITGLRPPSGASSTYRRPDQGVAPSAVLAAPYLSGRASMHHRDQTAPGGLHRVLDFDLDLAGQDSKISWCRRPRPYWQSAKVGPPGQWKPAELSAEYFFGQK